MRLALAMLACAAFPALALDTPQWPPAESVETRMRELQLVIGARESTPGQRETAREELAGLLKSPAGRLREAMPGEKRPARAAIEPSPAIVVPVNIAPAPPPPGGVAHIEVTSPPRPVIIPHSGVAVAPTGKFAIDPRTGHILHEAGSGYIDPRTGQFVPR
ncbi:MAG: hypothetical protein ABIQ72_06625 [Usitatibacter sp.]